MNDNDNPLRFNVGFIIAEANGYSREFPILSCNLQLDSDLTLHSLKGSITITRTAEGLFVQADLIAELLNTCVRCLEDFNQKVHVQFVELFNFLSHVRQDNDLVVPYTGYLDLSPLTREYILLELPINPICREDCKGLCPICGENLNMTTCHHDEEEIDPRFEVLTQWNHHS
jgi:uncharacterized protein